MSIQSGIPRVISSEVDIPTTVQTFPGVYTGLVIPATKGPLRPYLASGETDVLNVFTPNQTIKPGYDMSYFDALAYFIYGNSLWISRAVHSDCLYGGITLQTSAGTNVSWVAGKHLSDILSYSFTTDDALLIYGTNPGKWNGDVTVQVYGYVGNEILVKELGAFVIQVYNNGILVESWTCSLDPSHKDGYGQNIFVEKRLLGSQYISARVNPSLDITAHLYPTDQSISMSLGGGVDGSTPTIGDLEAAMSNMSNPNTYPMTLFIDGGHTVNGDSSDTPWQLAIQEFCEGANQRKNKTFGILTTPLALENNADPLSALTTYRNTTLNINSSYVGLYGPHVNIYDKYNDREVKVSSSGYVAGLVSRTAANQEIWYPAAGNRRGVINVDDLNVHYNDVVAGSLYDNGINSFLAVPGKGYVLKGQKTLYSRPSYLTRTHVRLLLIVVESACQNYLDDFIFEQNTKATQGECRAGLIAALNNYVGRNGIYDFRVVCDSTNNSATDISNFQMNVYIFIKPVIDIEWIPFKTIITPYGYDFSLAQQLVMAA